MRVRSRAFATIAAGLFVASLAAVTVAARQTPTNGLVVHEWGTFTSVAGQNGQSVEWAPFSGPQDLPCFVTKYGSLQAIEPATGQPTPVYLKDINFVNFLTPDGEPLTGAEFLPALRAAVRMETPVLYFYSPTDTTVSVSVRFPQGLITEWYPQAAVPLVAMTKPAIENGSIAWNAVRVRPGSPESFLTEKGSSHYYAARATDAAPISANGQNEKFLFYRGIANFPVRLSTVVNGTRVTITPASTFAPPQAILFESDGKKMGYRVLGPLSDAVIVDRPALTNDLSSPVMRDELQALLVARGLYEREAKAMIETWRDSWFEPGLRLMYITPSPSVDSVLPLTVSPAPEHLTRVFVGRVEMFTPEMIATVAELLRSKDRVGLEHYGRFLEPIANQLLSTMTLSEQATATSTLRLVAAEFSARIAVAARTCH